MDNHRVGRRDIDAGLDDVGGQQDVRLAIGKTGHDIVKLGRRHAAMGRQDARIRHQHRQPVIDALQIVDARADAEDLAATEHLALYGLAQDHAVPRADKGAHRQPVDRRRGNQRHLAHARQRHLQRARDRRRRQRQNMDIATQLLQPFLLRDAKMLFLIDNQQAEIVEFNGFCQKRVRTHGNLHITRCDSGADFLCRRRLCHAGQHADGDREPGKAFGEDPAMLARQKGRRRDERHLIARHGGDKGGAQRHFGLAEADIAADQPVRGPARRQIADHILDRAKLVLGLGKAEAVAEFGKTSGRRVQRLGACGLPLRRDLDQLVRHVADPALDPGHPRLPGRTAQLVELRVGACTAIARQHLDVLDRKIELVTAGIDKLQAIMRPARGIDDHQPFIAPDAVFGMNDEIAFFKGADFAQEILAAPATGPRT